MTTLNVQAVITAVDRLTGPLATMGGKLQGMQNRFSSAAVAAASYAQGSAAAAAGLIAATTSGQYDLDKALRDFQVVGTSTAKQRREMGSLADQIAVKLGMPQLEVIQGATELLQAGLDVGDLTQKGADGVSMLQNIGEAAKVAGDSIANMSKDLVVLAKSFEMPWASSPERMESMKRLQGLAIVAPRLSPDSPSEHIRALGEFGAVAAQLGMTPEESSSLQSVLSSAGFTGSRGGMALKTILQRLVNPTPGAQAQMQAAGFNYGKIFKTDLSGLTSDQLIQALGMGGIHAGKAKGVIDQHLRKGQAGGDALDILRWRGELEDKISTSLGLKKGDAQNRRIIKKSVDNILATRQGGLNVVSFLEELQKMPVAAFKDMFGLHHATKGAVLKFKESLRSYQSNLERLQEEAPGAVSEGLAVRLEGFAFQVDRLASAWTFFKNAISTTGAFGGALDQVSNALIGIASMEPSRLDALSAGITNLTFGLAGLATASAGVWVLARLGTLLGGPLGKILAAGGLAALAGGLTPRQFNENGAIQNGASPIMDFVNEATGLAGDLVTAFDDVARAAAGLGGVDLGASAIITSLQLMTALLRDARQTIEWFRSGEGVSNPNKDWGIMDLLMPFNAEEYARKKRGDPEQPSPYNPMPRGLPAPYDDWWGSIKNWWSGAGATGQTEGLGTAEIVQRLDSPLQVIMSEPPTAKLEGSGTVNVTVRVEGPGELSGVSASDDGKNIKLNTGGGMPDTNR